MSEDTLNLILQRLDRMEHEQTERFERIDQRFERIDQRFAQVEREQTRLRTDLVNQMERVLATMQLVREDVTVAMAYAARADSATDATATIQRSLQSQLGQLRSRVERLEGKQGDGA
ncbi:MAG: hypothetical protein ABSC95_30115 [Acetobacteraceae bacterium]|jgi:hypothetical protein